MIRQALSEEAANKSKKSEKNHKNERKYKFSETLVAIIEAIVTTILPPKIAYRSLFTSCFYF